MLHNIQLPGSQEPGSYAPGRTLDTQREHAETMPNPEMESQVRALEQTRPCTCAHALEALQLCLPYQWFLYSNQQR